LIRIASGATNLAGAPFWHEPSYTEPMTLRITVSEPGPPTTVKVDGRLTGDQVPELQQVCAEIEGALVLDLTDLNFADRQGVKALHELQAKGADLIGVSQFIGLLLERSSQGTGNLTD